MTAPTNPTAAPSLAQVIAAHTGGLIPVPPADLQLWLPDLTVPPGWVGGTVSGARVTRILLRRLGDGHDWDGCEVLKLHRVPGAVGETMVLNNATASCGTAVPPRSARTESTPQWVMG